MTCADGLRRYCERFVNTVSDYLFGQTPLTAEGRRLFPRRDGGFPVIVRVGFFHCPDSPSRETDPHVNDV